MTEIDWLAGSDPAGMLEHLQDRATPRKLRLFACACVRRFWPLLRYTIPRDAVVFAESLAEGTADSSRVEEMRLQIERWTGDAPEFEQFAYLAAAATLAEQATDAARNAREYARQQAVRIVAYEMTPSENEVHAVALASEAECRGQAGLLNELFGNPFKPVVIEPHWLTWAGGSVVAVAREIDDAQRFDELPYLADALMDAGCNDETLLRHLRRRDGHMRGCWALDAVTGKG